MAAYRCPKHGMQIASHFCEHAAAAIDERSPVTLYLQPAPWGGWTTLCDPCAQRLHEPEVLAEAYALMCGTCVVEWAEDTASDYVQRCQDPTPEFPPSSP